MSINVSTNVVSVSKDNLYLFLGEVFVFFINICSQDSCVKEIFTLLGEISFKSILAIIFIFSNQNIEKFFLKNLFFDYKTLIKNISIFTKISAFFSFCLKSIGNGISHFKSIKLSFNFQTNFAKRFVEEVVSDGVINWLKSKENKFLSNFGKKFIFKNVVVTTVLKKIKQYSWVYSFENNWSKNTHIEKIRNFLMSLFLRVEEVWFQVLVSELLKEENPDIFFSLLKASREKLFKVIQERKVFARLFFSLNNQNEFLKNLKEFFLKSLLTSEEKNLIRKKYDFMVNLDSTSEEENNEETVEEEIKKQKTIDNIEKDIEDEKRKKKFEDNKKFVDKAEEMISEFEKELIKEEIELFQYFVSLCNFLENSDLSLLKFLEISNSKIDSKSAFDIEFENFITNGSDVFQTLNMFLLNFSDLLANKEKMKNFFSFLKQVVLANKKTNEKFESSFEENLKKDFINQLKKLRMIILMSLEKEGFFFNLLKTFHEDIKDESFFSELREKIKSDNIQKLRNFLLLFLDEKKKFEEILPIIDNFTNLKDSKFNLSYYMENMLSFFDEYPEGQDVFLKELNNFFSKYFIRMEIKNHTKVEVVKRKELILSILIVSRTNPSDNFVVLEFNISGEIVK